jgi:hypothetical protein
MQLVDAFKDLPTARRWEQLVHRTPGLEVLADAAMRRDFDASVDSRFTSLGPLLDRDRPRTVVATIVGPSSVADDVVVRSVYAREFVLYHLCWLRQSAIGHDPAGGR